uniref:Uncharacterized protein n=1 Tax=uncultured Desulfobacterium sp. TaxID=201089 RepID=E1YJS5_9BACT|nr:unknown protein [uncultured Desulfobacterium sp.]
MIPIVPAPARPTRPFSGAGKCTAPEVSIDYVLFICRYICYNI